MPESKRRRPKHDGPTKPKEFRRGPVPPTHEGVILAYVHGGTVRGEFATSLFNTAKHVPDIIGVITRQSGPRIASARCGLVREFLLSPAEWFLTIDTDEYWSVADVQRLFAAADPVKRPIVAGLVFADQGGNVFPTMYKQNEEGNFNVALDYPRDRLVEVDGTGAGFMIIHRRVLERMQKEYPEPFPWYQEMVINEKDFGEDLIFCRRARELGYRVIVHTGVRVGHCKVRYLTETEYDRANDAGHFLITGTGRSGTGYLARLLSRCLIPVGHEEVFNPTNIAAKTTGFSHYRGEASWLAAPFLPLEVPTIQLVRNPLETLRSLVGIGFLARTNQGHEAYENWVHDTLDASAWGPTEDREEIIRRNVFFMREWSAMIEAHDLPRYRVEDLQDIDTVNEIIELMVGMRTDRAKVQQAIAEIPTDVNHRTRDESITWDDGGPELKELAERWGYETKTT